MCYHNQRCRAFRVVAFLSLSLLLGACSSKTDEAPISEPAPKAPTKFTAPTVLTGCGNGSIEAAEACDGGTCCTKGCKLIPADWKVVCDPLNGTLCTGNRPDCPTNTVAQVFPGVRAYDPARGVTP